MVKNYNGFGYFFGFLIYIYENLYIYIYIPSSPTKTEFLVSIC